MNNTFSWQGAGMVCQDGSGVRVCIPRVNDDRKVLFSCYRQLRVEGGSLSPVIRV